MKQSKPQHRYKKCKILGEGAYGTVTKVYNYKEKQFIALKKIKMTNTDSVIPVHAIRQISLLKNLQHPNIIRLYRVISQPESGKLSLYLEYFRQTLYDHVNSSVELSPFALKNYLFEILKALQFLQQNGFMHRDLKPQNIMVDDNCIIKLIDFGQVKKIHTGISHKTQNTRQIGTIWYKAPEVILDAPSYNHKVDMWALGCIMAEMFIGKPLFDGLNEIEQIIKIFKLLGTPKVQDFHDIYEWKGMAPRFPKFEKQQLIICNLDKEGHELLGDLLSIDPTKRPSAREAMKYKYFEALS